VKGVLRGVRDWENNRPLNNRSQQKRSIALFILLHF
jgi:hypothetical protein